MKLVPLPKRAQSDPWPLPPHEDTERKWPSRNQEVGSSPDPESANALILDSPGSREINVCYL